MGESVKTTFKDRTRQKFHAAGVFFKTGNAKVKASMCLMGLGQLLYKQWVKGFLYLAALAGAICYFVFFGVQSLQGFFSLGTVVADPWINKPGHNSVVFLLLGIFSWIVLALFVFLYVSNVRDVYRTQRRVETGRAPFTFKEELNQLINSKFYVSVLALPIIGVCVFNVLPIIFMVLIAFTNYGGEFVPPALIDWTGLDSFYRLLVLNEFGPTFLKILGWNMIWAVLATFINYFGGLGLALLLNKKCVKGRVFWRAFPILAYAIPGFITLLGFKFMFTLEGPINKILESMTGSQYNFFGGDAKWAPRIIGLAVNAWISIPTSMLLATGILSNMNTDLYEAASIDGANRFTQFMKLTLPFVLFSTTPVLISQFIGNFNNFGIFYFLRPDIISDGYFLANNTDLLINWLYSLSFSDGTNYYNIAAAISLIIFVISSVLSLMVYVFSPAYKKEETYR